MGMYIDAYGDGIWFVVATCRKKGREKELTERKIVNKERYLITYSQ